MSDASPVRVEIDANLCVGSAMCVGIDPDGFELGPDGHALYRRPVVDADLAAEAAEMCPVSAIRVIADEPGGTG